MKRDVVECPRCNQQVKGYNVGFDKEGNPSYHAHWIANNWKVISGVAQAIPSACPECDSSDIRCFFEVPNLTSR